MNLLPYIPFYNYRTKWTAKALDNIKTARNNTEVEDYYGDKMSWDVIEYYLLMAYDYEFFGSDWGPGLRICPTDLRRYYTNML